MMDTIPPGNGPTSENSMGNEIVSYAFTLHAGLLSSSRKESAPVPLPIEALAVLGASKPVNPNMEDSIENSRRMPRLSATMGSPARSIWPAISSLKRATPCPDSVCRRETRWTR